MARSGIKTHRAWYVYDLSFHVLLKVRKIYPSTQNATDGGENAHEFIILVLSAQ